MCTYFSETGQLRIWFAGGSTVTPLLFLIFFDFKFREMRKIKVSGQSCKPLWKEILSTKRAIYKHSNVLNVHKQIFKIQILDIYESLHPLRGILKPLLVIVQVSWSIFTLVTSINQSKNRLSSSLSKLIASIYHVFYVRKRANMLYQSVLDDYVNLNFKINHQLRFGFTYS